MIPTPTAQQQQIADAVGMPLNPDTNLPMPTPSPPQHELVDDLFVRMLDDPRVAHLVTEDTMPVLRDHLLALAIRQHGRTLRACIDQVREHAEGFDHDARSLVAQAVREPALPADPSLLGSAARLAAVAAVLRTITLGGTWA
jgi:hypothetical protein